MRIEQHIFFSEPGSFGVGQFCSLHFVDKIQNFLYMAVYIWLYNLQFISTNTYLSIVKILKRRWGLPSTDETNAQSKQETDSQCTTWG